MFQLALDTSASLPSVAVLKDNIVVSEWLGDQASHHSASLLQGIDTCLQNAKIQQSDLNFLSVGVGPGMFTGLRVGIATAKFFAAVLKIPVASVSSLSALALGAKAYAKPGQLLWALHDARSQRVYARSVVFEKLSAEFLINMDDAEEVALTPEEAAKKIKVGDLLIGEGAKLFLSHWPEGAQFVPDAANILLAKFVGEIGHNLFEKNKLITAAKLEPRYLKTGQTHLP